MRIGLEGLLDKASNSVYKLVLLAAKRALELAEGAPKLTVVTSADKPIGIALKEIREGKITAKVIGKQS